VTCPYACDATLTNPPYIDFTINSMSCPEENSGAWWNGTCLANAVIRWSRAGKSTPFYTNLSPWMWKRSVCCPNPGYSWAFNSPADKPIYYVAVQNPGIPQPGGGIFSHAVAAEYLAEGDAGNSTWQNWKFFQYENLNITVGDWQIPTGTSTDETEVVIKDIIGFASCGQANANSVLSFTIDQNNNIISHPAVFYLKGYIISKTGKTQFENQKIPDDLNNMLRSMNDNKQFTLSKWEFDPALNEITLYAHDINNQQEIDNLQRKSVGKYSIRIVHDTEFEKNLEDVRQQLAELRKNPDYQIAGMVMTTDTLNDPPQNYVELWVYKSTVENQKLNNTVINGWKILVYPESLPPSDIRNSKK
jgi:hypothetical protein